MDRERPGANDASPGTPSPGTPSAGPARRPVVAGLALVVVLLLVIAVLATRLVSAPASGSPAAAPSASPSPAITLAVSAIYQRVEPSMVTIRAGRELGAGVIVANDGTILTADHVVAGAKSITVTFADGTTGTASVASADAKLDIATLIPSRLPQVVVPATLGGNAAVGATVIAIGNPLGLTDSVTAGVISGLNRSASTDTGPRSGLIQFDAAVNPGSSGGPLLDTRGLVVGIVVALADTGGQDTFSGIGFAVPIGNALGVTGTGSGNGPQI